MASTDILLQVLGLIGFAAGVTGILALDDRLLKRCMTVQAALFAIQYAALGAWVAAGLKGINALRNYLAIDSSSTPVAACLIAVYWLIGTMTAETGLDWLAVVMISFTTLALFKWQGIRLRLVFIPANLTWIAIGLVNQSIGGVLFETLMLVLNGVTITRLWRQARAASIQ